RRATSFSNTRFLGGVQAGYNWQFDPRWLVGVEGDWDWTDTGYGFCRITDQFALPCSDILEGFETISSRTDWLATVRGRLGLVLGELAVLWDRRRCLGACQHDPNSKLFGFGCGNTANQIQTKPLNAPPGTQPSGPLNQVVLSFSRQCLAWLARVRLRL